MHIDEPPLRWIELPLRKASAVRHRIGLQPRLGRAVLAGEASSALVDAMNRVRPRVVLYAMSYLAAVRPQQRSARVVVDFANIEMERLASLATTGSLRRRASAASEALKARMWEPSVARSADVALAVSEFDEGRLASWGANTVVVPNAAEPVLDALPSDPRGPVVLVASFGYAPNFDATNAVLHHVWPRVLERVPDARLVLAGRESERNFGWARRLRGIAVTGDLESVAPVLAGASVVLAPVSRGGGTQLKVAEALAARRVVVATPYSARSATAELAAGCVVAESWPRYADAVADLLLDVPRRHRLEAVLAGAEVRGWDEVAAPLVERLRSVMNGGGSEPLRRRVVVGAQR